jgi:hypothetical protein
MLHLRYHEHDSVDLTHRGKRRRRVYPVTPSALHTQPTIRSVLQHCRIISLTLIWSDVNSRQGDDRASSYSAHQTPENEERSVGIA